MEPLVLDPEADPIRIFQKWFDEARAVEPMPETMNLATTDPDGAPASRMVLLKGVGPEGFVFYTNYQSAKSQQIEANPKAALCFWWQVLKRQVRIRGEISRVTDELSDSYFQSRPRMSQLGAWASPQSRELASREALLERLEAVRARFGDGPISRPPHWGGYVVRPSVIEFWREGDFRLHDRLVYTSHAAGWSQVRLGP